MKIEKVNESCTTLNNTDGQTVRASSEAIDLGLIPSRVKPLTLKLVFTASYLTFGIKETVWRTSRQVYLLYRWKGTLRDSPILV